MKRSEIYLYSERYINGEMSDAERVWFEKELEGNKALRDEVELRRATDRVIGDSREMRLMSAMNQAEISYFSDRKRALPLRRAFVQRSVAVALVIFLVAGSVWLPNRKLSPETLFERYYFLPPTAEQSVARSVEAGQDHLFSRAVESYNRGEYDEALNYLLQYRSNHQVTPGIEMMIGNSYMEMQEFTKAGSTYVSVIDHGNNLYLEDANFMLGLCYLKTDEIGKAISQFVEIAASESRYRGDASAILRRVRKKGVR